jgi:hypothetical protein
MVRIYIATGYNSFTHKTLTKAFLAPSEAEAFIEGLTAPSVNIFKAKSYLDLINTFLKEG